MVDSIFFFGQKDICESRIDYYICYPNLMTEFSVIPVLQLRLTPFFDQNPQNWISYKLRTYRQTDFATLVHWAVGTFLAAAAASTTAIAHSRINRNSINRLIPFCATVSTFLTLEEAPLRGVSVLLSYLSSLSHSFCVLIVYWINNPPGLTISPFGDFLCQNRKLQSTIQLR